MKKCVLVLADLVLAERALRLTVSLSLAAMPPAGHVEASRVAGRAPRVKSGLPRRDRSRPRAGSEGPLTLLAFPRSESAWHCCRSSSRDRHSNLNSLYALASLYPLLSYSIRQFFLFLRLSYVRYSFTLTVHPYLSLSLYMFYGGGEHPSFLFSPVFILLIL